MTAPPTSPRRPWSRDALERQVRALGEWFHNFDLDGVPTAPAHPLGDYPAVKWRRFAAALPADLSGCTVLDVGCNAGFYALEMKRRGATRVLGIDTDPRYLAQARFTSDYFGLPLELEQRSIYEIAGLGRFDLVLCLGVLYHLRHPLLGLDLLHDHVVGDRLVVQALLRGPDTVLEVPPDLPFSERAVFDHPAYPRLSFVEQSYTGDRTNWWIPNRAGLEAMLRSAGFELESHPEEEVYVCRRREARALEQPA